MNDITKHKSDWKMNHQTTDTTAQRFVFNSFSQGLHRKLFLYLKILNGAETISKNGRL